MTNLSAQKAVRATQQAQKRQVLDPETEAQRAKWREQKRKQAAKKAIKQ